MAHRAGRSLFTLHLANTYCHFSQSLFTFNLANAYCHFSLLTWLMLTVTFHSSLGQCLLSLFTLHLAVQNNFWTKLEWQGRKGSQSTSIRVYGYYKGRLLSSTVSLSFYFLILFTNTKKNNVTGWLEGFYGPSLVTSG